MLRRLLSRIPGGRSAALSELLAVGSEAPDFPLACDPGDTLRLAVPRGHANDGPLCSQTNNPRP